LIEETLFTRLSTFPGIIALVGTRIYPIFMPQGVIYPAITYQRISTEPRESCMVSDVGIVKPRFQITAWGETFATAKAIVDQVRQALQRWNTTGVQDTYIMGEYDLYDEISYKYGAAIDAQVVYEEVV
jgi:hypothetical protein